MRVWDLAPSYLCDKHLRAEHFEMHCIYTIVKKIETTPTDKIGYRNHPEVKRWVGKLPALKRRHDIVAEEMVRRGWNHKSPLEFYPGKLDQFDYVQSVEEQKKILRKKGCSCIRR